MKIYFTEQPVALESITLDKSAASVNVGDTVTLTATLNPTDYNGGETVIWASGNEEIATVDSGVVTGVSAGTATITASIGDIKATCAVTVSEPAAELNGISLSKNELELTVNEVVEIGEVLAVAYDPVNYGGDKTVTWESDNTGVVEIDEGCIYAYAAGTATITATCNGKSATCAVTVEEPKTINLVANDFDTFTKSTTKTHTTAEGLEITSSGWAVNASNSTYNLKQFRFYKNATIKITAPDSYIITNIVFTCFDSNKPEDDPSNISNTNGKYECSGKTGVWTGDLSSANFSVSSSEACYLKQITVTIKKAN